MKILKKTDSLDRGAAGGTKKLYMATFGCQMNEYDTQRMVQVLHGEYQPTTSPEDADLILLNTCSIREKAENKVYSLLGRFKRLKENNPGLIIGVAGCVAQQEGERLFSRIPHLDLVFGPQGITMLPDMIREIRTKGMPRLYTELKSDHPVPPVKSPLPEPDPVRTFVTIMQGCDNFCTYCVVPRVRGREISRPPDDIMEEVRRVIDQGVKDVTLLGQNVNSYGKKDGSLPGFAALLHEIASIPGLVRLRFVTSHPRDLSPEIMNCFREIPVLCEHLHLPVQSGSTRILKKMNRHYSRDQYLKKVEALRKACPSISLTTDLIVGFPGETDEDFEQTLSLMKEVQYDQLFAFKYSKRPFTKAAGMDNQVPEEIKTERIKEILELQNEIGLKRFRRFEGQTVEVLVEGASKADPEELAGHTRGNHTVNFKGPKETIGRIVPVLIEKACYHSLRGSITTTR